MTMTTAPAIQAETAAIWHPVPHLDEALQWAAQKLGRVSRICGAGAFWHTSGSVFADAWTELQEDGSGALTVRLGRLECIVDWRAPRSR